MTNSKTIIVPNEELKHLLSEFQSMLSKDCMVSSLLQMIADWCANNDDSIDMEEYSQTCTDMLRLTSALVRLEHKMRNLKFSTQSNESQIEELSNNGILADSTG